MSVGLPTTGSAPWHWTLADACERRADELRVQRLEQPTRNVYARDELSRREAAARERAEEHRALARAAEGRALVHDLAGPEGRL